MNKIEQRTEKRISNAKENINNRINQLMDELRLNANKIDLEEHLKSIEKNINDLCNGNSQFITTNIKQMDKNEIIDKLYSKLKKIWDTKKRNDYDYDYIMSMLSLCADDIIEDTSNKTIDERIDIYDVFSNVMENVYRDSDYFSIVCTKRVNGEVKVVYSKVYDDYNHAIEDYEELTEKVSNSNFMLQCQDTMAEDADAVFISENQYSYIIKNHATDEEFILELIEDNYNKIQTIDIF